MIRIPRQRTGLRALIACASVAAAAALPLTPAVAVVPAVPACQVTLTDSFGGAWDFNQSGPSQVDGSVTDGSIPGHHDAYDRFTSLDISTDGGLGWNVYASNDPALYDQCTTEDNGRELVTPVLNLGGLDVYRKTYVPDTGLAFARFLNVLTNNTAAPITVSLDIAGGRKANTDLGSDSSTLVTGSSSGDANSAAGDMSAMTSADDWATTADNPTSPTDPTLAHVWQDHAGQDQAEFAGINLYPDQLVWQYADVTIEPGQTVIYMTFEAMRATIAESVAAAQALAAAPAEALAGMSAAELKAVRNWNFATDWDSDGIPNTSDNCRQTANPGQADLDGDGKGDACDSDIDGDGLTNSVEEETGTNPRAADTDGDGVRDKQDACPKKAGTSADGCPVAQQAATPPLADMTPPNAQITSVTGATDLQDLLNGVTVTVTCDEACEAQTRLLARMPTGQAFFSAANGGFNRVLGRKYVPFGSGKRTVRIRPCEAKPDGPQSKACLARLRKAASGKRSFLVKVYVLAQDRTGNAKETSKLIRVRHG